MENAVFKATNRTECAPKPKHLQHLLASTFMREAHLSDLFRALTARLKENSWVVVFKTLIVIHSLIRNGDSDRVLACLASSPNTLNIAGFRDRSGTQGSEQTKNIHAYAMYLEEKVAVYRELKLDFTNEKSDTVSRLRKSTEMEGWLLKDISILQREIDFVLKCKFYLDEVNNEVTLTAYRLIVSDLLKLFHVENEGVMNLLEHYFEMVRSDARKSLDVYKTFCTQTAKVVEFLDSARRLQSLLGTTVPKMKHAPISLAVTLEEYLNSPDFEVNRIEYKASRSATDTTPKSSSTSDPEPSITKSALDKPATVPSSKKDEKDIIDFFSSIDGERTTAQVPIGSTGFGAGQGFGVETSGFPGGNPFGIGAGPSSQYSNTNVFGNFSGSGIQTQPFGTTTSLHNPFTPRQGSVHQFGNQQAVSSNPFGGPSHAPPFPVSGTGMYANQPFGPTRQYSIMSSSVAATNTNHYGAPMSVQRDVPVTSMGSTDYLAGPNNKIGGNGNIGSFGFSNSGNAFASQNPFASVPTSSNPVVPQDSLSSLNPFASKPLPASSLPMASMLPGHTGFGGGPGPTYVGSGIFPSVRSDVFGQGPGFGTMQSQQNIPYQQQQFQQQRQPSFPQQYQQPPGSSSSPWG